MEQLMNITQTGKEQTISSRDIAELTGKRHDNVIRDIEKLNKSYDNLRELKCKVSSYTVDSNTKSYKMYLLTKMQSLDLITGYSSELRIKVNRRWQYLEEKEQSNKLPQTFAEALQLAANKAMLIEEKERLMDRNLEYGFEKGVDCTPYHTVHPSNSQEFTDHALKIDTAKEIKQSM